jgi:hypothetical protein
MAEYERCVVLDFLTCSGDLQQVTVALADLGMRNDANALCAASRELVREAQSVVDIRFARASRALRAS